MDGGDGHADHTTRFREIVCRVVPPGATVLVVSKGDNRLVDLDGRLGWHFPQRADGVYAGYHPPDDASAVEHLEALREKGAQFLGIPSVGLWWLDHYTEFARHLEENYRREAHDPGAGVVFDLTQTGEQRPSTSDVIGAQRPQAGPAPDHAPLTELVDEGLVPDLRALIDVQFYGSQVQKGFDSPDAALMHYLTSGYLRGLDPHPLFETRWYLDAEPRARAAGANPLLHFVEHSLEEGQDPSPYFDTEFYYCQGALREAGANALVHYLTYAGQDRAYRPNPLFGSGYYLRRYPDVKAAGWAPLSHYIRFGADEGRYVSDAQENMVQSLRGPAKGGLTRGSWRRGSMLLLGHGD